MVNTVTCTVYAIKYNRNQLNKHKTTYYDI